jgi:RNA polymerase subunit RPABC4/transcription elongation factor Spt4
MKKLVCKDCKVLVKNGDVCPICKKPISKSSVNWQGQVNVLDPLRSKIAKKIGAKHKGEYAIKVN